MKRLFLSIALFSFALPAAAAADTATAGYWLKEGDDRYAARTAESGAEEALAAYLKAVESAPESGEARWKAARALYWLGDHAKTRRDSRMYFKAGIEQAEKAVEAAPRSPDAHFWLAGLYGSYGEARGVLKSLFLVKPIRRELEAILEINERYQGGAAHRVLGIVDYKVPGFAGGNKRRAEERLLKALEIDATNAFNHFYLAEFYALTGKTKQALAHLKKIDDLGPNRDVDAADLASVKEKARRLRATLSS